MRQLFKKTLRFVLTPLIIIDYFSYKNKLSNLKARFSLKISDFYPQIKDKTRQTGFDRHYVYHTSWAARKVREIGPLFHIDISSSLYFCGIVSAFVPVKFYDYRPANLELQNLESLTGNLLNLPFKDGSLYSLSCMHTIEHIGLGRYGDPIDPDGDLKAIRELMRVTAPGGSLIFVTPVGKTPRIEFNAHRIYSYDQIIQYFKGMSLLEFSLIPENAADGGIIINATKNDVDKERYGCGCFLFKKPL